MYLCIDSVFEILFKVTYLNLLLFETVYVLIVHLNYFYLKFVLHVLNEC